RPELRVIVRQAEPLAQKVTEGPVRHRFAIRDAPTLEPQHLVRRATQLCDEAALPYPRLAGNEEDRTRARAQLVKCAISGRELLVAPDKRRLDGRARRDC